MLTFLLTKKINKSKTEKSKKIMGYKCRKTIIIKNFKLSNFTQYLFLILNV